MSPTVHCLGQGIQDPPHQPTHRPKLTNLICTTGPASTPRFPKVPHDLSIFFTYFFSVESPLPTAQFPFAQIPLMLLQQTKGHLFQEACADFLSQSVFQPSLAIYLITMPCIRDKPDSLPPARFTDPS